MGLSLSKLTPQALPLLLPNQEGGGAQLRRQGGPLSKGFPKTWAGEQKSSTSAGDKALVRIRTGKKTSL